MTVEDMMTEVWESLDKDTMIDPTDASGAVDSSTDGFARILKWLNRGYNRVWSWKFRDGTLLRFPSAYATVNFKSTVYEDTASSGSAGGLVLPAGFSSVDDYYNNWVISLDSGTGSGQTRFVADYAGSSLNAVPAEDFSTAPDSDTVFTLSKRFVKFVGSGASDAGDNLVLDPTEDFGVVLKVTDLEDEQVLGQANRSQNYAGSLTETGTPSSYYFYGNAIYFDVVPDAARWYQMEYYKQPSELTTKDDEPDVPNIWHEGILLYALWWGRHWQGEFTEAYATKRDLIDFMETTKQSFEMQYERELGTLTVLSPTED